jgi:hypothetical protein
MAATIMHGNGMPHHLGKDDAGAAPGTNNFFVTTLVHHLNFFQQFRGNEGPLLERSRHSFYSLLL